MFVRIQDTYYNDRFIKSLHTPYYLDPQDKFWAKDRNIGKYAFNVSFVDKSQMTPFYYNTLQTCLEDFNRITGENYETIKQFNIN